MPLSRAETERALAAKLGLRLDRRDHRIYRLYVGDRYVLRTMVSTGTKHRTLGDSLVAAMARQLRVSVADFRAIVGCTIDREGYLDRLRDAGMLEPESEP